MQTWRRENKRHISRYMQERYDGVKADASFKTKNRAKVKAWRIKHPDKVYAQRAIRRARQAQAPIVERVYRKKVYNRDGGICHLCRKPVEFEKMHLDHVVPLSKGGEHSYANVKVAHATCNLSKGNRR